MPPTLYPLSSYAISPYRPTLFLRPAPYPPAPHHPSVLCHAALSSYSCVRRCPVLTWAMLLLSTAALQVQKARFVAVSR
eukprot:2807486-Rhodomonas_salina.2